MSFDKSPRNPTAEKKTTMITNAIAMATPNDHRRCTYSWKRLRIVLG
jgi:hypothetical protein